MPKRCAIVELSASRLELAVLTGDEVTSSATLRLSIPEYNENWPRTLESAVPQLKQLVDSCKAQGLQATLIYQAPTSAVLVTAVPATASNADAVQAAGLALADASNRPLAGNPHDLERIWTDAEPKVAVVEAAASHGHVLGMADSEESTAALGRFMQAAGLRPTGLIPAESLAYIAAVDCVLERSAASSGTAAAFYCGEHSSVLAAATAGRLRFVRRIGSGSELLVDALAREVRMGPDAATITIDHATAAAVLARSGIPARAQAYDTQSGLTADAVLPLLQPVLQRFIVEIKQSVRFGLDEKERGQVQFFGLGIGSTIPRLVQLIGEQASMSLDAASLAKPGEATSTSIGLIRQWTKGRKIKSQLLPVSMRKAVTASRVKRGMFVGFGVAAAMIVFSGITARIELADQLMRVQKAQSNLDATKPISDLNNRMLAAQAGTANAKQRIHAKLSSTMHWDAVLAMLSKCTPKDVKINESFMTFERGKPVCVISCHAPLPAGNDTNQAVRSFLDALSGVPLVKSTRLGATQRGEASGGPILSFEISITLVDLPADVAAPKSDVTLFPVDKEDSR